MIKMNAINHKEKQCLHKITIKVMIIKFNLHINKSSKVNQIN